MRSPLATPLRPGHRSTCLTVAAILLGVACAINAAISPEPSESFFTNVAARLLQQQLGVRLSEIQIAPTNQYSSAVHRLFQVTANIYDATSTNDFPAVFRPLFDARSNGVFLAGFTNDNCVSRSEEHTSELQSRFG